MFVRLSRKQNRSQHHLMDQFLRYMSRESHVYASIDKGFHHEEYVSWPSRTQCGCHVDLSLVLDANRFAKRVEHRANLLFLSFINRSTRRPCSYTFSDLSWCVRHCAHYGGVQKVVRNRFHPLAGHS